MTVRSVLIVGAGNMGVGIAVDFALAGVDVRLVSRTERRRAAARQGLDRLFGELAAAGLASDGARTVAVAEDWGQERPDVVVEAIVERASDKNRLFAKLQARFGDVAIWSTTSAIAVSQMSRSLPNPECLLVAHYANPAHLMPVVEIVPGPRTSEAVVEHCLGHLRAAGKKPVLVRHEPAGFVFNRLQYAVMREAVDLVRRGVISAEDLDTVVTHGYGLRLPVVGPLAMVDLSTAEVYDRIARLIVPDLCGDPEIPELAEMAHSQRTFRSWVSGDQDALRARLRAVLLDRLVREKRR